MRRVLLSTVVLVSLVLFAPDAASAGTYSVPACDQAPGGQNNSWQPFNLDIAHLHTGQSCPPSPTSGEPAKTTGLYATDILTGSGNAASGASAGWSFLAPPGMTIVAFQSDRYLGAYGDHGWLPSITADSTTLESCTFNFPEEQCTVGEPLGNANSLGSVIPVNNATALTAGITCTGPSGCLPGATIHHAWAALYGASVTLSETTVPTVQGVTGTLWGPGPANGLHKGNESVTLLASDPSGISRVVVLVDGRTVLTQPGTCEYTYPVPCQSRAFTVPLDTTQVEDGSHTLTLGVYDAAQNVTQLTHQVVIDNTAPATPSGLSATRVADGSDSVSWSDPPHAASITQANYQLCPVAGGPCQSPQAVPDQKRLSGLHPAKGRWQVKVWLTDAIGNVNPASAASVALPEPLILHLHHRLNGRRLTVDALIPREVVGSVSISYQALRGSRVLAHGEHRASIRRHRIRIVIHLPLSVRHARRLDVTARAAYALPANLVLALPGPKRR